MDRIEIRGRIMPGMLGKLAEDNVTFVGQSVGFEAYKSMVGFDAWASIEEKHR